MSCKCDADWACSCESDGSVTIGILGTKEGGTTRATKLQQKSHDLRDECNKVAPSNWFPIEDTLVICIDHLSIIDTH